MTQQEIELTAEQEAVFQEIKHLLTRIRFGSLEVSVHNGQIVQVECREKRRFTKPG